MPAKKKTRAPRKSGPRTSLDKRQMLLMMDEEVVVAIKTAAAEEGRPHSHLVEEVMKEWLAKRKTHKPSK